MTVDVPCPGEPFSLALDEAILISLSNAEVIRFLGGSTAQTVYGPAIANTQVDVERSRFDPAVTVNNFYDHNEAVGASRVPPDRARR